jgi:hypothetical protein
MEESPLLAQTTREKWGTRGSFAGRRALRLGGGNGRFRNGRGALLVETFGMRVRDQRIDPFAIRTEECDPAGKEIRFGQLHVVDAAVAALDQQLVIPAPSDHGNAAVPGEQGFIGLEGVGRLFAADSSLPGPRTVIGNNPERDRFVRPARPTWRCIFA